MSILESQSSRIKRYIFDYEKPTTYLSLMQKVGDAGRYQKKMLYVFMLNWFVSGIILLSNIFLFRNRLYDCQRTGLLLDDNECLQYICSLEESQWANYFAPDNNSFRSVATLNNYQCEDSLPIIIVSACTYIGATCGFLFVSMIADNYGRKISLIIAWGICTFGSVLVVFGFNIVVVAIGLFLSGFGSDASINITFLFFCEIVNNKQRQKYSIIMQMFFAIGGLVATTLFYLINDWRIVWGLLVVVPAVIEMFMIFCHIQQTPHFLIQKGSKVAIDSLNRIGMINLQRRQTLQEEDIYSVIDFQMIDSLKNISINHLDLCRFISLREKSIICSIIAFAVYGMYYGPARIASTIGWNIYTTSYIVHGSELLIYIPIYAFIEKIQRKQFGIVVLGIAVGSSLILALIQDPEKCGICLESAADIVLMIVFRAAVSFFFSFFQIYICQLFPSRVRGLSFGIISTVGSLSATVTPTILNVFIDNELNGMMVFTVVGVLAIGGLTLLPETMGIPLKEEIEEVEMHKMREYPEKFNKGMKKFLSDHSPKKERHTRMIRSQKN